MAMDGRWSYLTSRIIDVHLSVNVFGAVTKNVEHFQKTFRYLSMFRMGSGRYIDDERVGDGRS